MTTDGPRGKMQGARARGIPGRRCLGAAVALLLVAGGVDAQPRPGRVRPGISVLLSDSIGLVAGRRVGLITNHTGIDERGVATAVRLATDSLARARGVRLVRLFSPEHGLRGTEDRPGIADERDPVTGLPVISLYRRTTVGPTDDQLADVDVLVIDLQDIGTRTWTYVGVMLYAMQAASRRGIPVVVCDRPNPITGTRTEGWLLDSALASTVLDTTGRASNGFALWPMPLRHGLTMAELARFYRRALALPVALHVVPMTHWRRAMWFDETGLPWVRPSPNMPSLESALLYGATVPFEGTGLSVGRGTPEAFQRVGAPWLDADSVATLANGLDLPGVRFVAERVTPQAPTDGKFDGQELRAVRVVVVARDRVQPARVGAALLWAIGRRHPGALGIVERRVDERLGSTAARRALLEGGDPDGVVDLTVAGALAFQRATRDLWLYR